MSWFCWMMESSLYLCLPDGILQKQRNERGVGWRKGSDGGECLDVRCEAARLVNCVVTCM